VACQTFNLAQQPGQKKEEQDHTTPPASAAAGRAMAPRHAAWTTPPSTKKNASHDPDAAKLQDPACRKNPHEEHTRTLLLLLLLLPSPQCRLLMSTFPNARERHTPPSSYLHSHHLISGLSKTTTTRTQQQNSTHVTIIHQY